MGYTTRKPKPKEKKAIKAVISILEGYRGGVVVAHKHPLHKAVVSLEKFCIKRATQTGQPYKLFNPEKLMWFHLLWASRPQHDNLPVPKSSAYANISRSYLRQFSTGYDADPKLAMQWAKLLKDELLKWLIEFPVEVEE